MITLRKINYNRRDVAKTLINRKATDQMVTIGADRVLIHLHTLDQIIGYYVAMDRSDAEMLRDQLNTVLEGEE